MGKSRKVCLWKQVVVNMKSRGEEVLGHTDTRSQGLDKCLGCDGTREYSLRTKCEKYTSPRYKRGNKNE